MLTIGTNIDEQRLDGDLEHLKRDLTALAGKGFEAVELPVHGLDVIRGGKLDRRRLQAVRSILADFPFQYSVHAPDALNVMASGERQVHVDVFRASLEFASGINADRLVYHPGRYVPEELFFLGKALRQPPVKQRYLRDVEVSVIRGLAEAFPDIVICMENARPFLFHSPYCYAELLSPLREQVQKICRDNVRINLDVGHLYLSARFYDFDPVKAAEEVADLIAHAHVHDNFGTATYYHEKQQTRLVPFGKGDCHMPVGWGEIPIEHILASFLPNYDGLIVTELRGRYFEYAEESRSRLQDICDRVLFMPGPSTKVGGEACTA